MAKTMKEKVDPIEQLANHTIDCLRETEKDARMTKGFAYPKIMAELSRVARKCRAEGMYREAVDTAFLGLNLYEALSVLHRKDPHFKA